MTIMHDCRLCCQTGLDRAASNNKRRERNGALSVRRW